MEKKSVYSICKTVYLFQFLAHTLYKLELNMVHGHIHTPKNRVVHPLVRSTSSFLSKRTLSHRIFMRILSNSVLPWINSAAFLLKDQNQFDLGIFPFPNEMEMQYLLSLVFVDIALCIPFKTVI